MVNKWCSNRHFDFKHIIYSNVAIDCDFTKHIIFLKTYSLMEIDYVAIDYEVLLNI